MGKNVQNSVIARFHRSLIVLMLVLVACLTSTPAEASSPNDRLPTYGNDYYSDLAERLRREREEAAAERQDTQGFLFFHEDYKEDGKNVAMDVLCGEDANEHSLTEKVVRCVQGAITTAVLNFMEAFGTQFNAIVMATIMLAITIFGVKILTGMVQNPANEAFMLLLKIGAVLLFTNALGGFYPYIFGIMESFAGYTLSYITDPTDVQIESRSAFLESCAQAVINDGTFTGRSVTIWATIDCILGRLFTGGPTGTGVLWSLAVGVLWTSFIGIFVFLIMVNVFITILLLVLRCVYMFLACYAYLGLLIVISPLAIPLILFRNTIKHFEKWYRQFVSMLIQPMILLGLMAFFFAVLDSVFFLNKDYSLSAVLGADWTEPETRIGLGGETVETMLDDFEEDTGHNEDDWEYQYYHRWLLENQKIARIGVVEIYPDRLISIEINTSSTLEDAGHSVPVVGGVAGEVLGTAGAIFDHTAGWALEKMSKQIFPWKVPKVKAVGDTEVGEDGHYRSTHSLLWELAKFFLVVSIFLPLMVSFVKDIPRLMQYLSSARRTPGAVMPHEDKVLGAVGAAKGAVKGATKGAVSGFMQGGAKGAAAGAAQGAATGAKSGYNKAAGKRGGMEAAKTFNTGKAHQDNVMAKEGKGSERVFGKSGGGKGDLLSGKFREKLFDAGVKAATKGGGKGGGGGAGGGSGGGGAGGGAAG